MGATSQHATPVKRRREAVGGKRARGDLPVEPGVVLAVSVATPPSLWSQNLGDWPWQVTDTTLGDADEDTGSWDEAELAKRVGAAFGFNRARAEFVSEGSDRSAIVVLEGEPQPVQPRAEDAAYRRAAAALLPDPAMWDCPERALSGCEDASREGRVVSLLPNVVVTDVTDFRDPETRDRAAKAFVDLQRSGPVRVEPDTVIIKIPMDLWVTPSPAEWDAADAAHPEDGGLLHGSSRLSRQLSEFGELRHVVFDARPADMGIVYARFADADGVHAMTSAFYGMVWDRDVHPDGARGLEGLRFGVYLEVGEWGQLHGMERCLNPVAWRFLIGAPRGDAGLWSAVEWQMWWARTPALRVTDSRGRVPVPTGPNVHGTERLARVNAAWRAAYETDDGGKPQKRLRFGGEEVRYITKESDFADDDRSCESSSKPAPSLRGPPRNQMGRPDETSESLPDEVSFEVANPWDPPNLDPLPVAVA